LKKYTLLVKTDPQKTSEVSRDISDLPENPNPGVKLHYSFTVYGDWDICIWFEADNDDNANDFAKNKIAKIPGVTKTHILPSTILKEYAQEW